MKLLQANLLTVLDQMISEMGFSYSRDAAMELRRITEAYDDLPACAFARVWRSAKASDVSKNTMRRVKKRAMDEATGLARIRRRLEQDKNATLFLGSGFS